MSVFSNDKYDEIYKEIISSINEFKENYRQGPDLYFYKRIMNIYFFTEDLNEFINNNYNLEIMYATLVAWDMNSRGAKMKYYKDIKENILSLSNKFSKLWKKKIEHIDDIDDTLKVVGELYDNLHVMETNNRLISNSKLLHFIFPELLMPMDGRNTLTYFYKNNNESKNKYLKLLRWSYEMVKNRRIEWNKYIDREWNQTIPKILDNAIISKMGISVKRKTKKRKTKTNNMESKRGKYYGIKQYLENSNKEQEFLTFDEIQKIIGSNLPDSAYNYRAWWANTQTHSYAHLWLDMGWVVDSVTLGKNVIFRKNIKELIRER